VSPTSKDGTRTKLDREQVVDIALGIADTEGLDAVTIRRLAQDLSVTPMALYWHFKDKDSLLAALADRIWLRTWERFEAGGGPGETDPWVALEALLEALLGAMREHPALSALVPTRVMLCEPGLELTERTLTILGEIGFDGPTIAQVATFVMNGAVMLVDSQAGIEIPDAAAREEVMRQKRLALAALPPGRFPHVSEAADYFTDCHQPEAHYAAGASLLIGGIRHQASLLTAPA
jgi:TetR/AcrR family transcriptional regulator, tetracycline repressor protein